MPDIVHVASKIATGLRLRAEIILLGTAHENGSAVRPELVGGYRITMNVPKVEWDEWEQRMRDSDMVKEKMVFAHTNLATLRGMARAHAKVVGSARAVPQPK